MANGRDIQITLKFKDSVKKVKGKSFVTSPLDACRKGMKKQAKHIIISRVKYSKRDEFELNFGMYYFI